MNSIWVRLLLLGQVAGCAPVMLLQVTLRRASAGGSAHVTRLKTLCFHFVRPDPKPAMKVNLLEKKKMVRLRSPRVSKKNLSRREMRGPRFPAFSRISLLPIRKEEEKEELRNSKFPGTALASHLDSHLPKE